MAMKKAILPKGIAIPPTVAFGRGGALLVLLLATGLTEFGSLTAEETSEVKVERKTKLISNGKGRMPFDVTRHSIPLSKIERSIPKDAIPALINPQFISAQAAGKKLRDSDRVLGVLLNGEAKAYPVRILNWHELVNDVVGGRPVLVTWCPLCGSSLVYDALINNRRYMFGVSGLLYKNNVLFYDGETGSLWSQLLSQAVTGPMASTRLQVLPALDTTWGEWRRAHPNTQVLSFATGHARDYSADPYFSFPLDRQPALLVANKLESKIYPFSELEKAGPRVLDHVGGEEVTIVYDHASKTARANTPTGTVTSFVAFLNNLREFYSEAAIFKAPKR